MSHLPRKLFGWLVNHSETLFSSRRTVYATNSISLFMKLEVKSGWCGAVNRHKYEEWFLQPVQKLPSWLKLLPQFRFNSTTQIGTTILIQFWGQTLTINVDSWTNPQLLFLVFTIYDRFFFTFLKLLVFNWIRTMVGAVTVIVNGKITELTGIINAVIDVY